MQKTGILTGAFFMLIAVALGAFGAHGLKNLISAESILVFKTGVFYQFIHGLSIFIVLIIAKLYDISNLKRSIWFFILGVFFFSGSLYFLSTKSFTGLDLPLLGPMTPIGGLFFILGWLSLIIEVWKTKIE